MGKAREWTSRDGGSVIVEMDTIYGNTRTTVGHVREVLPCKWKHDGFHGHYQTECGNGFIVANDEGLMDTGFTFCVYCGGPIVST